MRRTPKWMFTATAVVLLLGGCDKGSSWFGREDDNQSFVKTIETDGKDGSVAMLLPDFTQLVEQEGAAVVNIQASRDAGARNPADSAGMDQSQFPDNDPFYEFFKRLVPNMPSEPQDAEENFNFGSGFIISPDGYILTNTHVLAGMNNIKVLLNDKREYSAKLVGSDAQSDVALLKIDAQDLPTVKVGNPKQLKVGEWVAAIGAPFGFDNSVTAGIVSAKGRSLPNENYTPFIQTDVAINPGNSGGPLFNLKGQVIGINSQIYSRSGGFMGISFAIPIDVAMNVADQLKTSGKVQRGQLGVIIQEVSYSLAKSFGMDKPTGALIAKVLPNGPAAKAGLQVGDIVRSVNGEEVRTSTELPVMVGNLVPGKEVTLGIWRKGQQIEQKVVLGSANDGQNGNEVATGAVEPQSTESKQFAIENLGLTMREVDKQGQKELVVAGVNGPAHNAGVREGDRILSIGQAAITDEASLRAALETAGKNIPLLIERQGSTLFLAISIQ